MLSGVKIEQNPYHARGTGQCAAGGKDGEAMNHDQTESRGRPRKRSGGQPGNWNAFKHGFYSRRYRPLEVSDLNTVMSDDLTGEIALLRVIIRRVFEFAGTEATDLDSWTKALNSLGAAATRLAGLMRTQQILTGGGTDMVDILSQVIGEVANDLGLIDPSQY
jgi:hypothetical protein